MKIVKNLRKPMLFHRFSRFREGSEARNIEKIVKNCFREIKRAKNMAKGGQERLRDGKIEAKRRPKTH